MLFLSSQKFRAPSRMRAQPVPALPDERAARSVISGFSGSFRQIHHFPPPATFFSFSPFHRLRSELRKKSVTLIFCNFCD